MLARNFLLISWFRMLTGLLTWIKYVCKICLLVLRRVGCGKNDLKSRDLILLKSLMTYHLTKLKQLPVYCNDLKEGSSHSFS